MKREQLVEKILDIKREKGWTWKHITEEIGGMSAILVVGALLGQMKLPKSLAEKAGSLFGLSEDESDGWIHIHRDFSPAKSADLFNEDCRLKRPHERTLHPPSRLRPKGLLLEHIQINGVIKELG